LLQEIEIAAMRPSTMTTVWWGIKRSVSIGTALTSTTALGHYRRGTSSGLVEEFSRLIEPTCAAKSTASALSPAANNPERNRKEMGPDFEKRLPQEMATGLEVGHDEFRMNLSGE